MEQLLPLLVRNVLPIQVATIFIDLCKFFKLLCTKVLSHDEVDKLKEQIFLIMCIVSSIILHDYGSSYGASS